MVVSYYSQVLQLRALGRFTCEELDKLFLEDRPYRNL